MKAALLYVQDFDIETCDVRDITQVGKVNIPKIKEKKGVIRVSYTIEGINDEVAA